MKLKTIIPDLFNKYLPFKLRNCKSPIRKNN